MSQEATNFLLKSGLNFFLD